MNEPQRRSLKAVTAPVELSPEAVAAIGARHGFRAEPAAATAPAIERGEAPKRLRQPKGRTENFSTKLRMDTKQSIYDWANARNIGIAEVIELAMDALKQQG